jgi:hypothetical protein
MILFDSDNARNEVLKTTLLVSVCACMNILKYNTVDI